MEIEVLKEMIKGVQIQLKSKDNEVLRLNKKVLQADGAKLAKQLHQNITIFNNYRTGSEAEALQNLIDGHNQPISARKSSLAPLTSLKASPLRNKRNGRSSSIS